MRLISLTQNTLQSAVEAAAEAILAGQVILAPTDTVYGIIADATNKKAVDRVYSVKQRDKTKPLPFFVKNIAMAKKLANVTKSQEKILEEYWPGKITVILNKKRGAKIFGSSEDTIAIRIPFHSFINSLLEMVNVPLCGTSANISGLPASIKIDDVLGQFAGKKDSPDLVINAGDLEESRPSTIVDFTKEDHPIVRD